MTQTTLDSTTDEDEWKDLKVRASSFGSNMRYHEGRLNDHSTTKALLARLSTITVEKVELSKSRARGRVRRGQDVLFDTGETTKNTCDSRMERFLKQQIVLDATREAGK